MELGEAIKRLSTLPLASRDFEAEEDNKAVQLGIEALIRERNNRINPGAYEGLLLLGETKG